MLFEKYSIDDVIPELGSTLAEELLSIHKSYLSIIKELRKFPGLHGFSHITGGGIPGNTKRILPEGCSLKVNWDSWKRPLVFHLIQRTGSVPETDMRNSFNLGIGLVAIVDASMEDEISVIAAKNGEEVIPVGKVV